MAEEIKHVANANISDEWRAAAPFGIERARRVRAFHASFPTYQPTALRRLDGLAGKLGLGALFVKDESSRFGLNAFKSLGGSYCVGRLIADLAGVPEGDLTFGLLRQTDVRAIAKALTLVTATDGNHGRGIAWTARELGAAAVVYMPKGTSHERFENILALGAQAQITDMNYDDTVRFAAQRAEEKGWILVQDTAWEGYEEVPMRIMQGYTTLALETVEQLGGQPRMQYNGQPRMQSNGQLGGQPRMRPDEQLDVQASTMPGEQPPTQLNEQPPTQLNGQLDGQPPTHVFLQAGVGSMSSALAAFFADCYRENRPTIVIVEPNAADCVFRTAAANDGLLHKVGGDLGTIMAGLACGEPCTIGWEMMRRYADHFVSVSDEFAKRGMRVLARPEGADEPIVSGESGAVGVGLVVELMTNEGLAAFRDSIGLGSDSKVLCISTEGDTDRESYRRIVSGI